ncbi:DUF2845 domain-containing protein [Dyella sp. C9]|uniref:DUF2845 domain-containing protein n=1 Tax=Dyella sp. C9 TaxID=2202154 RepID=UPI001E4D5CA6|nr:DUF2845 domain-containing protein [Dyella sp. C9]
MRAWPGVVLMVLAVSAQAGGGTLRVGSQVLTVGDSATRVIELLGKPSYKGHATSEARGGSRSRRSGSGRRGGSGGGEQWQYRQNGRVVTVVIVDGRVATIRDGGR